MSNESTREGAGDGPALDLGARMRALADEVGAELGLAIAHASLPAFEQSIAGRRASDDDIVRWGAFVGEAMIRDGGADLSWIDFATAAARDPKIAALGLAADTSAMLRSDRGMCLPLAKVVKFLRNGQEDSLAAFAGAMGAMLRKPAPPEPVDPETRCPEGVALVDRFLASPSIDTLRDLRKRLTDEEHVHVLRIRRVTPDAFYPFLGAAPVGRGFHQFVPGRAAVDQLHRLAQHRLADPRADLAARLGDRDARVRHDVAWALGAAQIALGDDAGFVALYERSDAAVRVGALAGLAWVVWRAVYDRRGYDGIAPHARVLTAGLRGKPDERTHALDALFAASVRLHLDVSEVLDAVLDVLDAGKPAQLEKALEVLQGHLWSVMHGRSPFDALVPLVIERAARHTHAPAGKVKTTKVQIAASWALSAAEKLAAAPQLTGEQRALVSRALAQHATGAPRPR